MFKKLFVSLSVIIVTFISVSLLSPTPTYAANDCRDFLGMVSWDCGTGFTDGSTVTEDSLKSGIWQIATNITNDIVTIIGYLALGFVIYGGYLYVFSEGDPGKIASGKKTLSRAFIGLAIVASAKIILASIATALGVNNFDGDCVTSECVSPSTLVTSAISWAIGIVGAIAAIFIVYGGITYITSAGDPGKLEKAKKTILFSLIGLIIVALSEAITNFVISDLVNTAVTATGDSDIAPFIISILNSIVAVAGTVAVAFILVGGVQYMTSTGDASKVEKAKKTILYACIGLAICALAFAIVNFAVKSILLQ